MKKFLFLITSLAVILIAPISWKNVTFSQEGLPYPEIKPDSSPNGVTACTQSVANEIYIMRNDWTANLKDMLDQEKPTSELVDPAFDSMRTYRCWLDYLCKSVRISSAVKTMEASDAIASKIIKEAGCVDAEDVEIPSTEIKFMPYCAAGEAGETLTNVENNYSQCRELVGYIFGEVPQNPEKAKLSQKDIEKMRGESTAFIMLEGLLRIKTAEKKSNAMQNKLTSIISKMHEMEAHVDLFKQHLTTFDLKLPCYADKCN